MIEIERKVSLSRVWISGSWPLVGGESDNLLYISQVAEEIGKVIAEHGLSLVSGAGLVVGAASISGFLTSLQKQGSWDLERRLIARPFPQALEGQEPNKQQWRTLRAEMARISGTVIFLGGAKWDGNQYISAEGVREEIEAAREAGRFLLPVGSTGGIAKLLAEEMLLEPGPRSRNLARRPSKSDIRILLDRKDPKFVAGAVLSVLQKTYQHP